MTFKVRVANSAKQDAKEFALYVREREKSPEPARRWLNGLYSRIADLSENPARFAVIPEAEELGIPYRSFNYYSHRVVYFVNEAEKFVVVHRVYHGSRKPLDKKDF